MNVSKPHRTWIIVHESDEPPKLSAEVTRLLVLSTIANQSYRQTVRTCMWVMLIGIINASIGDSATALTGVVVYLLLDAVVSQWQKHVWDKKLKAALNGH